jgi:hypothetical protein
MDYFLNDIDCTGLIRLVHRRGSSPHERRRLTRSNSIWLYRISQAQNPRMLATVSTSCGHYMRHWPYWGAPQEREIYVVRRETGKE